MRIKPCAAEIAGLRQKKEMKKGGGRKNSLCEDGMSKQEQMRKVKRMEI